MIIVKSPLRISFFGGSTDYESFYKEHGSFLIGATIDKYVWLSARLRPSILPREHCLSYSRLEVVSSVHDIKNPLIREILKHSGIKDYIDFTHSADVPSRTGLGGSSSFCAGMVYLLKKIMGEQVTKKELAKTAIHIERNLLKESGGIQDQIYATYGGFSNIEIDKKGNFSVKPMPVSDDFRRDFENSIVLIYTNGQRKQNTIAKSYENKDKMKIRELALEAYTYFLKEDIKGVGELLFESWKEKRQISNLISTKKIDAIVEEIMNMGAYGTKLLGSGGCGFLLAICNPKVKKTILEKFKENVLQIKFENRGTSMVYPHEG